MRSAGRSTLISLVSSAAAIRPFSLQPLYLRGLLAGHPRSGPGVHLGLAGQLRGVSAHPMGSLLATAQITSGPGGYSARTSVTVPTALTQL
jgi:hypothetical protein